MMMRYYFFPLIILVAVLLALPARADEKPQLEGSVHIHFPATNRDQQIEGGGYLLLPPNVKGRVPVMIIMHGSGGIRPEHEYVYARELANMGVAAFIVDSFTPRGIETTYDNQRLIVMRDYVRDAFAALAALRKEPHVDTSRAGIIGFSKGGIVGLYAAMKYNRGFLKIKKNLVFKAHYLFYPGCAAEYYDKSTTGAPITMFLGDKDEYSGMEPCIALADKYKAAGANISTIIYKDAEHAWDIPLTLSHPNAEVLKECHFVQQADGSWNETKSGITHMPNLRGDLYDKALQGCLTHGVTTHKNPQARAKVMDDFKALVRQQLLGK
jgi:dienelactone hydrolase